jgi:hypothetical protein
VLHRLPFEGFVIPLGLGFGLVVHACAFQIPTHTTPVHQTEARA